MWSKFSQERKELAELLRKAANEILNMSCEIDALEDSLIRIKQERLKKCQNKDGIASDVPNGTIRNLYLQVISFVQNVGKKLLNVRILSTKS